VLSLPQEWTSKFRLVNQRLLLGGLKKDTWPKDLAEIVRVLKPGGWVQIVEPYTTINGATGPATKKLVSFMDKMRQHTGIYVECAYHMASMMAEAGFINIKEDSRQTPLGLTGGKLGVDGRDNLTRMYRGMKAGALKAGGFGIIHSEKEFDELVDSVEAEWDRTEGVTFGWLAIVGQKPVI